MFEENVRKSLSDLIDETLYELEELKKSRYAAAEVDLKGPGEGIAGKPCDGDLNAKKAEDDKEYAEEDDKKKKKKEEEEAAKAECKNEEASKAEGKNEEAAKAEDDSKKPEDKDSKKEPHKDDPEHEKKEKEMAKKLLDMHKAQEEFPTLMKSFVEERVKPLEDKLSTIFDLVKQIADQPIPPKGTPAKAVPLLKSAEDSGEALTKADVASKLFELKKSGTKVDSLDIARAEMGHDLAKIVEKYKIS